MTQRLQLVIGDNLDWHENREHTDADETLTISLDGEIKRLDLTGDHALELRTFLRRYLDAGDDPDQAPALPDEQLAVRNEVSGWVVHRDMRAWADRNMPGSYSRRVNGRTGYDYAAELRRAFWGYLSDIGHPMHRHRVFADLHDRSTP
jgi:hypothetical protein